MSSAFPFLSFLFFLFSFYKLFSSFFSRVINYDFASSHFIWFFLKSFNLGLFFAWWAGLIHKIWLNNERLVSWFRLRLGSVPYTFPFRWLNNSSYVPYAFSTLKSVLFIYFGRTENLAEFLPDRSDNYTNFVSLCGPLVLNAPYMGHR